MVLPGLTHSQGSNFSEISTLPEGELEMQIPTPAIRRVGFSNPVLGPRNLHLMSTPGDSDAGSPRFNL